MNLEKKQQARNLFLQTELTKSQIASMLNVSRRTVSYWSKEDNWQRLKTAATHMPSILADNCYHLIGQMQESCLSERRINNPITAKEVDTMHKLALTVGKLKNRSTVNESMEMFGFFLDGLKRRNPRLAEEIAPYVDEYISGRASIYAADLRPDHFTGIGGRIPWIEEDKTEQQLDAREAFFSDPDTIEAYAAAGIEIPSEEAISTLPPETPAPPPYDIRERNEERQAIVRQLTNDRRENPRHSPRHPFHAENAESPVSPISPTDSSRSTRSGESSASEKVGERSAIFAQLCAKIGQK
jgi:DNA-binding XRE family transcriptional regulator